MGGRVIELTVEAKQDMMLIIRMTTSGVLSRADLTMDDIDDMKMAVDEACTCLMNQRENYSNLRLVYTYSGNEVSVSVKGCEGKPEEKAPHEEMDCGQYDELLRCILESMADEVTIERTKEEAICGIVLKKRRILTGDGAYV